MGCEKTITPGSVQKKDRYLTLFKRFVLKANTLETLSLIRGRSVSQRTLRRSFDRFLEGPPTPQKLKERQKIWLKVDAHYLGHWGCVIVAKTGKQIIHWDLVERETYFDYSCLFVELRDLGYDILGLTSDWHGSIVASFSSYFPQQPHQRCLVHTQRLCETLMTRNPKTEAGRQLLQISKHLNSIHTHYEKEIWIRWFLRFEKRYSFFLNQRSYEPGTRHWWFTHKNTRRAYRSIKTTLDHLFLYLDHQGLEKDTNGLEAEFTHLTDKLNIHHGLTRERRKNLVTWYFHFKSIRKRSAPKTIKKPTRFVH